MTYAQAGCRPLGVMKTRKGLFMPTEDGNLMIKEIDLCFSLSRLRHIQVSYFSSQQNFLKLQDFLQSTRFVEFKLMMIYKEKCTHS